MKYRAAIDFILERTDYERWPGYNYASRFDLRRMDDLLLRLGSPHLSARAVHIAGSKGKGSTAAMIAAALCAAGYRTGLYTSPHLVSIRERIKVDGRPILKREITEVVTKMRGHVEEMDRELTYGELSTFELLTAAAFMHFQQKKVDFQVLETGLGGRLDATNMVTPEVCVITSISFDHTEVLGDTLAQIAAEKAGIIKPGIPVVSSPQPEEAAAVIKDACVKRKAGLITAGKDVSWVETGFTLSGQSLEVQGIKGSYRITIPLLGSYQVQNAVTAVAALEILGLPKEKIERGLANTDWPGRLQILRRRPLLVVDGAHTKDSARKLKEALKQYFHFNRLILIIGVSADKDISGIVAELAPIADVVIATSSRHPRAMPIESVVNEFVHQGIRAEKAEGVAQAVRRAQERARKGDLICATGSLFLVGEVIEYIKDLRPEIYT
ncbi:MAG: bifunctional folylpolyglutamate synthase/dihydrofolate synthase [Dehalococcoidia bacterium]|nr:bifunctional folylpolyglutamate synthase/dihydrofolate synthase [Dehalococcoidia bacterium]